MRRGGVSLLAACFALAAVVASAKEAVLTATGANFEEIITKNDFVAVEFYASWCGHCKKLAPEWEKAAKTLKDNDPPIILAKVEATEEGNKELATKYNVGGFPTIKVFKDGNLETPADYNGPREADGIVAYLKGRAGPASAEVTSSAQIEKLKEAEAAVVGVFKGKSSPELKAFLGVADAQRDSFAFGHTFDAKLAGKGVSAPGVILFKQYDDPQTVFEGELTSEALTAWLDEKSLPLVAELDQKPRNSKAVGAMFAKPTDKVIVIFDKEGKDAKAFNDATYASASKSTKLKHLIISTKGNEQALKFFGLEEKDAPAIVVQNGEEEKFIKTHAAASDLPKFVSDFQAGKLQPTIKSEEPPASNSGPVKIVTAKTFDELVFSGNDVLLEFYAPWCGHCKQLAPTFDKVGKAFKKNKTVTIAKIDATANDVPKKFAVRGFPTITFINGKDGAISSYSGDRSEADLIAFVKRKGAAAPEEDEYETDLHEEL